MKKFKCPCCGYYTLMNKPTNTFDICPVCSWEDDGLQLLEPDRENGANSVSLNQAKKNFKEIGASDSKYLSIVRAPNKDELDGIDWSINDMNM